MNSDVSRQRRDADSNASALTIAARAASTYLLCRVTLDRSPFRLSCSSTGRTTRKPTNIAPGQPPDALRPLRIELASSSCPSRAGRRCGSRGARRPTSRRGPRCGKRFAVGSSTGTASASFSGTTCRSSPSCSDRGTTRRRCRTCRTGPSGLGFFLPTLCVVSSALSVEPGVVAELRRDRRRRSRPSWCRPGRRTPTRPRSAADRSCRSSATASGNTPWPRGA